MELVKPSLYFSVSVLRNPTQSLRRLPRAFKLLRRDVGDATQLTARVARLSHISCPIWQPYTVLYHRLRVSQLASALMSCWKLTYYNIPYSISYKGYSNLSRRVRCIFKCVSPHLPHRSWTCRLQSCCQSPAEGSTCL